MGPNILGATARDFSEILTHVSRQRQVFVFPGDVEVGISPNQYIQLPPVIRYAEDRIHEIGILDPSKPWESLRVYDTGRCSSLRFENTWLALASAIPPGLRERLRSEDGLVNPRVVAYRFAPVIRAQATTTGAPVLLGDADFFHVDLLVRADRANGTFVHCAKPEIRITFNLRATLVRPLYRAGAIVQKVLPDSTPYMGPTATCCFEWTEEAREISVNVVGGGMVTVTQQQGFDGACGSIVRRGIRDQFLAVSGAVAAEVGKAWNNSLERNRVAVGLEARECQEDVECTDTEGLWRGHMGPAGFFVSDQEPLVLRTGTCDLGTHMCTTHLSPNRLNFRPQGLEVVWADDAGDLDSAGIRDDSMDCDVDRNGPQVTDVALVNLTGWQSAPFVRRPDLLGSFDPGSVVF